MPKQIKVFDVEAKFVDIEIIQRGVIIPCFPEAVEFISTLFGKTRWLGQGNIKLENF